jgi:uncharacterized protein
MDLYLGKPTAFQVMLKPAGPVCNLNCAYCYYLEKEKLFCGEKHFALEGIVLEEFIRQHIEAHQVPVVQFVFQGGEPMLMGIEYYRNILALQEKYKGEKRIENILQTNGTLLNDEWCRFLYKNQFLVGISIDGPKHLHDKYRTYRNGEGSFDKVMQGVKLLQKHNVEYNTLTVINDMNAEYPLEVYHFLKDLGSRYMQFLPVVERIAENVEDEDLRLVQPDDSRLSFVSEWSVTPGKFADFMIAIFDEWVRKDVGQYYVQMFDTALANWHGVMPGLCVFAETCGEATCMEHNGDMFTCDHYVFPEQKLGNIMDTPLIEMIKSEKQTRFGLNKRDTLPQQCRQCHYRFACNGGCPKMRFKKTEDGETGLNYLCEGYYQFFEYVHPYMQFMSDELKKKNPPANVMSWVKKMDMRAVTEKKPKIPGRNEPCFCGSGRKFKLCCMKKIR